MGDNIIRTSSEYIYGVCGEHVYNVLPYNTLYTSPPQALYIPHIIYTDIIYDKKIKKFLNEINELLTNNTF